MKWQLDMVEGPSRMRKRLVRDELFYLRYPYKPENKEKPLKYKRPTSHDSQLYYEKHHNLYMFEREDRALELEYDDCDIAVQDKAEERTIDEQIREIGFQGLKSAASSNGFSESDPSEVENDDDIETEDGGNDENESEAIDSEKVANSEQTNVNSSSEPLVEEFSSAYQSVMRLLENGEKIVSMFRCARIQGLDTIEGILLFGKEHFYVIDGFTIVNHREVHDIDFMPANQYEPIIPTVPGQMPRIKPKRTVSKFAFDDVREVHKRRYLLQPIAVEVFSNNWQNYLLAFPKQSRNKVYQKLSGLATSILDSAAQSVS